jgi:hypothetical protein
MWWERFVKRKIRHLFVSEGTERRRKETTMENFCHACLYDVLQGTNPQEEEMAILNNLKAKLVRLYRTKLARGAIDTHKLDTLQRERVSVFHLLKRRTRWDQSARPGQGHTDFNEGHYERLQHLHVA